MAIVTGLTSDVVSHAGTFNAAMLALLKPGSFTLDTNADSLDTTAYASGAAIVRSKIKGLRSWTVDMEAFQATPINGIAGSISGAAYTTSIQRYNLSLRAQPIDTTAWPITSQWRTSSPGLVEWSGNYDAIVDTSTAITEAGSSTEPLNVTFTLASGQTLAGTLFTTNAQVVSRVGELVVVRYSFDGTGHIVSVGSSNIIPAASTIATPLAGSLVLKAHEGGGTDKTYTGDAFWTEISLTVDPAAVISVRVRYQGTGALTPA
jgi:hypothetical protein